METTEKTIWINLPEDEKLTILSNIAEEKGIKENAVEKDFWVSMVLKAMFLSLIHITVGCLHMSLRP